MNISDITKKIIDNLAEESNWNDKLIKHSDYNEVEEVLCQRSEALRRMYAENIKLYDELRGYINSTYDRAMADELFEAARAFIISGSQDREIICALSEPLIDYYKSVGDVERAITVSVFRSGNYYEYFVRQNPHAKKIEEVKDSLRWVISNKDKYSTFKDYRAQINLLNAYHQLILIEMTEARENKQEQTPALDLVYEVLGFWADPAIQEASLSRDHAERLIRSIKTGILMEMEIENDMKGADQKRYLKLLEDYYRENRSSEQWHVQEILKHIDLRIKYAKKETNEAYLYDSYRQMLFDLPQTDWESESGRADHVIMLFVFFYLYLLKNMKKLDMPYEKRGEDIMAILNVLYRIAKERPYQYQTTYINDIYRHLFLATVPHISSLETFEYLMEKLMLTRQPFTYLHADMVAKIAEKIACVMLEKQPQLFLSLPEFKNMTGEGVKEHSSQLFEMIKRSAYMHDLGKCDVATLIMRQARKITEEEFECIKRHSMGGAVYLEELSDDGKKAPMYMVCHDVMLGHHKSYNGKAGYPESYDNTKSKYKIIVDLITIADSMDAATDVQGRNYAAKKNLLQLIEELRRGAGSRYNPDIVEIIAGDEKLLAELREMTEDKRTHYVYEVYKNLNGKDETWTA